MDYEKEALLLASLIHYPELRKLAYAKIDESYLSTRHKLMFHLMKDIEAEDVNAFITELTYTASENNALTAIGGKKYIQLISQLDVDASIFKKLTRDIVDQGKLYSLHNDIKKILAKDKYEEAIKELNQAFLKTSTTSNTDDVLDMQTAIKRANRRDKNKQRITLPVEALSELFNNLSTGEVVTIAGRPNMGKSALLTQIALHLGYENIANAIFSMEMTCPQMISRLQRQSEDDDVSDLPISLYMKGGMTIDNIASNIARLKEKNNTKVFSLDYFQLLGGDKSSFAMEEKSRALADIAVNMDVLLLIGAQLNRNTAIEGYPRLHHLKGCGALEEDSHRVVLIHRETPADREGLLIVAKNRHGSLKDIPVDFLANSLTFQ